MSRLQGPRCKHVKVNGTRCESPALREQAYCYFHYRARQRELPPPPVSQKERGEGRAAAEEGALTAEGLRPLCPPADLFLLEDANAIQCAVEWVLRRLLEGSLEHRRAALLLHGLEIASGNIKLTNFRPLPSELIKAAPAGRRGGSVQMGAGQVEEETAAE
jgi:hypothetical protein